MYFITTISKITKTIFFVVLFLPGLLFAHNNPEFTNKPITSIEVNPSASSKNEIFTFTPPEETVRVVWSIKSENKDQITFSVQQGNEIIAKNIKSGDETKPGIFKGEKLSIIDIKGTDSTFTLDILARVIKEKKKKTASVDTSAGKSVYKKANCVGCHKWHGDGGGGYGGAALSLRTTGLDAKWFRYVVRCGRPGTGMPYHGRNAYKGDDTSCYETTRAELGENMPPRARNLLNDRQLDAVVDYSMNVVKGSGEITLEQCVAYWGEKSRQCDALRKK